MRSHRIEIALYWRWYSIYFTVISLFRKIFEVLKTKITSYQTFRRPSWFQQRKSCVRIILTILQSEYQQIFSYRSFAKSLSLHKKMKFSIKEFFSKCDQIRRTLRIWSHLMKKSLMEFFVQCVIVVLSAVGTNFKKNFHGSFSGSQSYMLGKPLFV